MPTTFRAAVADTRDYPKIAVSLRPTGVPSEVSADFADGDTLYEVGARLRGALGIPVDGYAPGVEYCVYLKTAEGDPAITLLSGYHIHGGTPRFSQGSADYLLQRGLVRWHAPSTELTVGDLLQSERAGLLRETRTVTAFIQRHYTYGPAGAGFDPSYLSHLPWDQIAGFLDWLARGTTAAAVAVGTKRAAAQIFGRLQHHRAELERQGAPDPLEVVQIAKKVTNNSAAQTSPEDLGRLLGLPADLVEELERISVADLLALQRAYGEEQREPLKQRRGGPEPAVTDAKQERARKEVPRRARRPRRGP